MHENTTPADRVVNAFMDEFAARRGGYVMQANAAIVDMADEYAEVTGMNMSDWLYERLYGLFCKAVERQARASVLIGDEWFVMVKDDLDFSFKDSKGRDRRFRFRIKRPSILEWSDVGDVTQFEDYLGGGAGSHDFDPDAPAFSIEGSISCIRRDGDTLVVSTFTSSWRMKADPEGDGFVFTKDSTR